MVRYFDPRMATAFLPVADRYVGYPISVEEAATSGVAIVFGADWRLRMTLEQQIKWAADYSRSLLYSLQTGDLPSFVEQPASGRWYRVPKEHWWPFERLEASLPLVDGEWHGRSDDMIGQPVVVWRDEAEAIFRKRRDDADHKASVETHGVATPTVAPKVGYNKDSTWDAISDWYKTRVNQAPEAGYKRKEDEEAGIAAGIGRDRTRELRAQFAPSHWHRGGRPKRQLGENG